MNKNDVISQIVDSGILPVIRAASTDEARVVVEAVAAGGIRTIEVTMTVPNAVDLIAELSADSELLIGAGTVRDKKTAQACIDAGARFIISPSTDFEAIRYCNERGVAVIPGALTPTEIVGAWKAGADIVKVFPVSSMGGATYIRSIKAPFPDIRLIPTGGVDLSNAGEFFRAGAEAVGVGAELVDLDAIRKGDPESITQTARAYIEAVRLARSS